MYCVLGSKGLAQVQDPVGDVRVNEPEGGDAGKDVHISDSEQIDSDDDDDSDNDDPDLENVTRKFKKQTTTIFIPSRRVYGVNLSNTYIYHSTSTSTYTSIAPDEKDAQIAKLQSNVVDLNVKVAKLESIVNSQLDLLHDLSETNIMKLNAQEESSSGYKEDKPKMTKDDDTADPHDTLGGE
ncbi:hypothetical protein L1987_48420 [Smallanthus sonchifolius]|uniref:Uncharacterized protein n=1 Tax=Smallanthus sonchifolius TaxID=185202 RepID=A0ACB9FSU3_9ASTR|nr:hypothetical protein L1987_48420 [Smallanthus sonchifolius]